MNEILFKDLRVEHICKTTLKNSYISIVPSLENEKNYAKIILKSPRVSKNYIKKLLTDKEVWIRKQILKIELQEVKTINLEDEVLLFGEIYSIDVDEAKILRNYLQRLKTVDKNTILNAYNKFYKQYAKDYITPRLEYFAQEMNLSYTEVKFRKMKSRWGSCSSKKSITFNTELMKVKKELIDYVIVHELSHLTHMNHSKEFHSLVDEYIYDSKLKRKELKNIILSRF